MAALEEALGALHTLTAETLTNIIKDGVPIVNKETGEIEGYAPAPAPYIAAASSKDFSAFDDSRAEFVPCSILPTLPPMSMNV